MALDDGRVVSNFIAQALKNSGITLYGSGEQTRSFCYVDDLVDGLIKMMESDIKIVGPINLGNPEERTIKYLAEKIVELVGSHSLIEYKKLPQDDPERRMPNIEKALTILNWKPKVDLNMGLEKTIAYFRKII
jgi:UDP-glucuronate decarboxylase